MLDLYRKELVALEVIQVLVSRFENFPQDASGNRNAPFHDAFLRAFVDRVPKGIDIPYLISLSSWLHGLNTTIGQSFFENVAHILSNGEKRGFTGKTNAALQITLDQQIAISEIITALKNGTWAPNLTHEDELLFQAIGDRAHLIAAPNFTADNFVQDDRSIEAIELKTVQPNSGVLRDEKTKILSAKAALMTNYPDKEIRFFIGFPFDPLNQEATGFDKARFINSIVGGDKFLDPNEILLADELWDRLSGEENTMRQILEIINVIATPQFEQEITFLANPQNVYDDPQRYQKLLLLWGLHRESLLFQHRERIKNFKGKLIERTKHKRVFAPSGEYNHVRFAILSEAIRNADASASRLG